MEDQILFFTIKRHRATMQSRRRRKHAIEQRHVCLRVAEDDAVDQLHECMRVIFDSEIRKKNFTYQHFFIDTYAKDCGIRFLITITSKTWLWKQFLFLNHYMVGFISFLLRGTLINDGHIRILYYLIAFNNKYVHIYGHPYKYNFYCGLCSYGMFLMQYGLFPFPLMVIFDFAWEGK